MPSNNESALTLLHSGSSVRNEDNVLMTRTPDHLQREVMTNSTRDVPLSEPHDPTNAKANNTTAAVESIKNTMLEIVVEHSRFSPEEANHVTIDDNDIKSPVHNQDDEDKFHSETPNKSKQPRNSNIQNLDGILDQNLSMQSKVATTGSDLSPFSGISSVGTYESTGCSGLPSTVSCPVRMLSDPIDCQGNNIGAAIEFNTNSPSQTLEIESIGSDTDQSGLTPIPLSASPESQTKERQNEILSNYFEIDKSWSHEYNKYNHHQQPVPYDPSFGFSWEDRMHYHYNGYHPTSYTYGSMHRYQSPFYVKTFQQHDNVAGYHTHTNGMARTPTRRNNSLSAISHKATERKVLLKPMNIVGESSPGQQLSSPRRQVNTNPRFVLRSVRKAFSHLTYLLPFLRSGNDICSVSISSCHSTIRHYKTLTDAKDSTDESEGSNRALKTAKRRVDCAIRYFGGNPSPSDINKVPIPQWSQPIFRFQAAGSRKQKYAEKLKSRFFLNGSRTSWDLEENPPIHIASTNGNALENTQSSTVHTQPSDPPTNIKAQTSANDRSSDSSDSSRETVTRPNNCSSCDESEHSEHAVAKASNKVSLSNKKSNNKVKYHCKRCGQPKQNHRCPFEERLQRSIGVMVHTAINAYMAEEPGLLAPTLTEMNNFVAYDENPFDFNQESPPLNPFERTAGTHNTNYSTTTTTVTPEQRMRLTGDAIPSGFQLDKQQNERLISSVKNAPISNTEDSFSYRSGSTSKFINTRGINYREVRVDQAILKGKRTLSQYLMDNNDRETQQSIPASTSGVPRTLEFNPPSCIDSHSDSRQKFSFVPAVAIRPEQYRSVTVEHEIENPEAYQYPSIPLPGCERQRLSDTLFFIISWCMPDIQSECVQILHDVRKKTSSENGGTEWDLAVAELLTQVIVGVYCVDNDEQLEGLSNYLKRFGIAC